MPEYLTVKAADCKDCYKCIRNCPVKSIKFENNQAQLVPEECVLCGNCVVTCPQNTWEIRNDLPRVEELVKGAAPVMVSLAPSFRANWLDLPLQAMASALGRLGFAGVEETALGATMVKQRYDDLVNEGDQSPLLSTCCPTVNMLIEKYYPEALPFTAKVMSPMSAHCMDMKRRNQGAKTVFIGPCVAKKAEAERFADTGADYVLTFGELSSWFRASGIDPSAIGTPAEGDASSSGDSSPPGEGRARLFPTAGGILRSMKRENKNYSYIAVDGMENCIRYIEDVIQGKLDRCFIELSACAGSCVGGPGMESGSRSASARNFIAVDHSAGETDFDVYQYSPQTLAQKFESRALRKVHLGDEAVEEVLRKIGKTKPKDELNCGACGYDTCRAKARAVLEGKATLSMCLPYLREKAESLSDNIIKNTPNAIVVLNENFEVKVINNSACRLFNINASSILGGQVMHILDPGPFMDAYEKKMNMGARRVYLPDYSKYVEQAIIYDNSNNTIICIMRDVTEETVRSEEKEQFSRKAVAITDQVIEKQMRTVQEIASLLGETTAETKIALTQLKESLSHE